MESDSLRGTLEKMGLKPIHIGDKKDNDSGKLKSISDGLYNFILNS